MNPKTNRLDRVSRRYEVGVVQQHLAGGRQAQPAAAAVQQPDPDFGLQERDLAGRSRRR
jgi:hypothetical protein